MLMTAIRQRSEAGLSHVACDGGEGTPVVLLHGIGSNAHSFVPLMQALAGRCRSVAWDAPGYGESQPLACAWPDASDYAAALDRLLAGLAISRCVLAGHSLGALIAGRFALLFPQRVAALVLLSPALGYGAEPGSALPPAVADRIEQLDRLGARQFAAARAPGLLADPIGRPDVLQAVERAMAQVRRPGYDQAARLLAGGNLIEDARRIDVPSLLMVGAQDRITPPASVRRAFDALRGPPQRHAYCEIANAGHALSQEQPDEVADAIAGFAATASKADAHA
jgi:pimeloyl-ACP methyl ester carboxylesterase